jgi:hypothetical protein
VLKRNFVFVSVQSSQFFFFSPVNIGACWYTFSDIVFHVLTGFYKCIYRKRRMLEDGEEKIWQKNTRDEKGE